MIIKFYPDSDMRNLEEPLKRYREIWEKEGKKIVEKIEDISGLKFKENFINAVVFLAKMPSRSYPLSLKAYTSDDIKRAVLVHELCHRILAGNKIGLLKRKTKYGHERTLEIHKVVYLILYDIWVDLYGERFAKKSVKMESNFPGANAYKEAWNWVLSFSREERLKKFERLRGRNQ